MNFPIRPTKNYFHSSRYVIRSYFAHEVLILKYATIQEINRIRQMGTWITSRTRKQWLIAGASTSFIILLSLGVLTALFLNPHSHTYSFSDNNNCFLNPIVLPNTFKSSGTENYTISSKPKISIAQTPLLSTTTCLEITTIPESQAQDTLSIKSPITIEKDITLTPEGLPQVSAFENLSEPVSTDAVLLFNINQSDKTFTYRLAIQDKITDCVLHDTLLGCPLAKHELAQGQTYGYTIHRVLNDQSSQALSGTIATLDPVTILTSSIAQNENVYTKPNEVILTTNKTLRSASKITLKSTDTQLDYPVTTKMTDQSLSIAFKDELPRNTGFTLQIEDIVSSDGAFLTEPYILHFKTSAGPQLQSSSIGSYKVNPGSSITLTFDVELDPNQQITDSVKLVSGGNVIASVVSIRNNTVTINPVDILNSCTTYAVSVNDQISSKFGVTGGSTWSMQTRTICQQVFSIGNSVQGRSITGYKFGNGATKIVFIGGLHGNEKSSVLTLNSWIDELERNYQNIPADKSIVVIPNTNPDGYIASSRLNANNIDLNRNFPSSNWQSAVHIPGGIYLENGGGANALSEPESSAVANYLIGASPRLVLTYHATAGAVIYNGSGDSSALSTIYSDKSGYSNLSSAEEDGLFNYPTTGEMEDWLRDKRNVPTMLVELATQYSNNFTRQKSAMWAMLSR